MNDEQLDGTARCCAHFFSLNNGMSGGTVMSFALEVFLCVGFGEIVAPLRVLIYGRSRGELLRRGERRGARGEDNEDKRRGTRGEG